MKKRFSSISSHDGSHSDQSLKRQRHLFNNLDCQTCTWCCYIWGDQEKYIISALVLGKSLKDAGTQAKMVACVDSRTLKLPIAETLRLYWNIREVQPLSVGRHKDTAMQRHINVYSKLQAWKLFDNDDEWQCSRVVMLDVNMLWRGKTCDAIWNTKTPAAVIRGNANSSLLTPQPRHTFFDKAGVRGYEKGRTQMKGGINAGLVIFTPSKDVFRNMYATLTTQQWQPQTKMPVQEFLSYFFAKSESWYALDPHYNFQIQEQLLSSDWDPPHGQNSASNHYQIMHNTELILNWHFSDNFGPVDCLCKDLNLGDNDEIKASKNHTSAINSENQESCRMLQTHNVHQLATEEWLQSWSSTYKDLFALTLYSINERALTFSDSDDDATWSYMCNVCNHRWESLEELQREGREHVLVHCPFVSDHISMPIEKLPNLMLLPLAPVGKHVIAQLTYLGAVLRRWHQYRKVPQDWSPLHHEGCIHARNEEMLRICLPTYDSSYGPLIPPTPEEASEGEQHASNYEQRFIAAMAEICENYASEGTEHCLNHYTIPSSLENGISAWKGYQRCTNGT